MNDNIVPQSDTISASPEMSREEAHEHLNEIKAHASTVRKLLLALDERKGWSALGEGRSGINWTALNTTGN